jgi:hypothetical protein
VKGDAARLPVALDETRIHETLLRLGEIGTRYHATNGEAMCREYLLERFSTVGLESVRLEPFSYLACEPLAAACSITAPHEERLPCRPLQFTANAEIEAEAVFLGRGAASDLERVDALGATLEGKIAVIHTPFPFLVAPLFEGRGIAGLVNVSDAPDGLVADFTAAFWPPPLDEPCEGRPLPFPGVTVELEAGRRLVSTMSLATPVRLRLGQRSAYRTTEGANVVGSIPGDSGERVVVGAHYDTQASSPGSWDNGTGIASLLEIARALMTLRPRRTVDVVAFAVEEIGLIGSASYARAHAADLEATIGMVNLDALGSRLRGKRAILSDSVLQRLAVETARSIGWEPEGIWDVRLHPASDYYSFTDRGIPACQFLEFPPVCPYYHTSGDTLALVDPVLVAELATVAATVVGRLAREPAEALAFDAELPRAAAGSSILDAS